MGISSTLAATGRPATNVTDNLAELVKNTTSMRIVVIPKAYKTTDQSTTFLNLNGDKLTTSNPADFKAQYDVLRQNDQSTILVAKGICVEERDNMLAPAASEALKAGTTEARVVYNELVSHMSPSEVASIQQPSALDRDGCNANGTKLAA